MNRFIRKVLSLILIGVFVVAQFSLAAAQDGTPPSPDTTEDRQVSSIVETQAHSEESSFTVSWQTKTPGSGWVEYGTALDRLDTLAHDVRGSGVVDTYHSVQIEGLTPRSVYYYAIVTLASDFSQVRTFYKIATGGDGVLSQLADGSAESAADPADSSALQQKVFLPLASAGASSVSASDSAVPGQYIVVLKDSQTRAAASPDGIAQSVALFAQRAVENYGGTLLYTYDVALEGFAAALPVTAAAALQSDPNVAYVEPNRIVRVSDTQTGPPWGLDRADQNSLPLNSSYTYPSTKGAGVHAYIVDTGIRSTHQQFSGRIGAGYTSINDGKGSNDCNGHGTHVAGTVGGSTYGVAKGVTLHPVRVLGCNGGGTDAGVIAGINWVIANAVKPAVLNMSLGGEASSSLDTAVNNAVASGIVVAVAAGNDNQNACNVSPARAANALTVGATTILDSRASYSNYGACLDLFAPGHNVLSAYNSSDTASNYLNGTSMASPHVAGAAALYLAVNSSASPAQVAQALISNASVNKVTSPGTGSPNRLLYMGFLNGGGTTDPDDNRVLGSGQTLNGTINPTSDLDTYYFDASQGQLATIRMNKASGASLDSYLILYAPNGTLVAQDDDGGGDLNSLINRMTLPQNGRYRIVSKSYGGGSSGGYTLSLTLESAGDPDDGRTISSGQTLNGTINPASDQDTYYFNATQGQLVTLRMNKASGSSLDSFLTLYAPNGSQVAQDDDSGGNYNSLINRVTLPQNGRYRTVSKSYGGGSSGSYSLNLTLGSACTPGANGVVLYEHGNHTGRCITFTGDDSDFNNDSFNDIVSSIRFVGSYATGWEAQVYEHSNYGGVSTTYRGNDSDFGNDTIGHDRTSSIRIRRTSTGNIALNKSANATSWESASYPPYKGNDGNTGTRWSSQNSSNLGGQWWWTDLGSRQTFDRVVVRWEAAYAARYFIGWSDDGSNFTGYWYSLSSAGSYSHNLGTRTARYLGIYMDVRAPGMNNYSFWEYEAYQGTRSADDAGAESVLLQPNGDIVTLEMSENAANHSLYLPAIGR